MAKDKKAPPSKSDINITPFIDILLVLLVIFMVITPITTTGLDAAVPQPPPPGTPPPSPEDIARTVVVSLDAQGILKINQEEVLLADLGSRLLDIFRTRAERVMFVNADPDLLFSDVISIIDLGKGAGADRIGLMTEQITGRPQ